MQHHKYQLPQLEKLMPWEREIYMGLLVEFLREEKERVEQENRKSK